MGRDLFAAPPAADPPFAGGVFDLPETGMPARLEAIAAGPAPHGPAPSWEEVPDLAWQNLGPSAERLVEDTYEALSHPLETFGHAQDLIGGLSFYATDPLVDLMPWAAPPGYLEWRRTSPDVQHWRDTADAAWDYLVDRYGSWEALRRTIATDPVGVVGDAATVGMGAGGALRAGGKLAVAVGRAAPRAAGAAEKVAGAAERLARGTDKVAAYGDPWSLTGKVADGTLTAAGRLPAPVLGAGTGAGRAAVETAYDAGRTGGEAAEVFAANMRGAADLADAVTAARAGVAELQNAAKRDWLQSPAGLAESRAVLPYDALLESYDRLRAATHSDAGKPKAGPAEMRQIEELGDLLLDYAGDPRLQGPVEMDALRQRIARLPDGGAGSPMRQVKAALADSIQVTIAEGAPGYAAAMRAPARADRRVGALEQALDRGDPAAIADSLRRLQAVLREAGAAGPAPRVPPALAGQSLSEWVPPGARGPAYHGAGAYGLTTLNPAVLPYLAVSSPRLAGELAFGAGRIAGSPPVRALGGVRMPPAAANAAYQAERLQDDARQRLPSLRERAER